MKNIMNIKSPLNRPFKPNHANMIGLIILIMISCVMGQPDINPSLKKDINFNVEQIAVTEDFRMVVERPLALELFLEDTVSVKDALQSDLEKIGAFLNWRTDMRLEIIGFTQDNSNTKAKTIADEAMDIFLQNMNLKPGRIQSSDGGSILEIEDELMNEIPDGNNLILCNLINIESEKKEKQSITIRNTIFVADSLPLSDYTFHSLLSFGWVYRPNSGLINDQPSEPEQLSDTEIIWNLNSFTNVDSITITYECIPFDHNLIESVSAFDGFLHLTDEQGNEMETDPVTSRIPSRINETFLRIVVSGATFKTGSSKLLKATKRNLEPFGTFFSWQNGFDITIEGYTDNTGSEKGNLRVSKARANSVKSFLMSDYGFAESRLTHIGMGKQFPTATNDTKEGRAKNRRIEFIINSDYKQSISDEKPLINESKTQLVTLMKKQGNRAPTLAFIPNKTSLEDSIFVFVIPATDLDGDTLSFSALSTEADVRVETYFDTLKIIPNDNWHGESDITVHVSDGQFDASRTFTLTVYEINDLPVLDIMDHQTILEDSVGIISLSGSDEDDDVLMYTVSSSNMNVYPVVKDSILSLKPVENWNGTAEITVNVSDGKAMDTKRFTVTVINVNDAPTLSTIDPKKTNEDMELRFNIPATDLDGDSLLYSATSSDLNLISTTKRDTLILTPTEHWFGNADITVVVSDGQLESSQTFTLTVLSVNDIPILEFIEDMATKEDSIKRVPIYATDADGDIISFTVQSSDMNVTADVVDEMIVLTPAKSWSGSTTISLLASDGKEDVEQTFTLIVSDVNHAPELAPIQPQFSYDNEEYSVRMNARDMDGDPLSFSVSSSDVNVNAVINGESVVITPTLDWIGSAEITVQLSDGILDTSQSFTHTVTLREYPDRLLVLYDGILDEFTYDEINETIVSLVTAPIEELAPIITSALDTLSEISVISHTESNAMSQDCLSEECIQKMAEMLHATELITWSMNQKRGVIKLTFEHKMIDSENPKNTVTSYYAGDFTNLEDKIRQTCNELYQKSPKEKWSLRKGSLMTDYYIGTAKVMIGTGLVSGAGLAVILLAEEDLGPPIGDPPLWPGE